MLWERWVIYGIPVTLGLAVIWSAGESAASRALKADEIVLASGEGVTPSLNPFFPVCEVDRQVAALVHEPLLRIGQDGQIAPGLVEKWNWTQTSSVWFAGQKFAQDAEKKLAALDAASKEALGLRDVTRTGAELRLAFAIPGAQAPERLLKVIADCGPLPVEFLRVDLGEAARSYHDFFMKNAVEREQVKRVWFDGANAYELAISGETVKFVQELNLFYQNRPALRPRITSLGRAPLLHRPQLELFLRSAKFSDGSEVMPEDVWATLAFVLDQPWPVAGRDVLQMITGWEKTGAHSLRLAFKEIHGPALTAFIGLPVLPVGWIMRHADSFARGAGSPFLDHPPPGTGRGRLEPVKARTIGVSASRRVIFMLNQPPATIRMGFAMRVVDGFWPEWKSVPALGREPDVVVRASAPRSRLLVMWNCRRPPLDSVLVRRALGLAVDRERLNRDLMLGQGVVHEGIFRPGLWFARQLPSQGYDPVEAKRLLSAAGWTEKEGGLAKEGKSFCLDLLTLAGNHDRAEIAARLRESWAALGIEATVSTVGSQELVNQRLPEHRFDAVLLGLDFETSWDQSTYWHSSQARSGLNFSGLSDATLDGLLEALRSEFDPARVPALARDVENRILAAQPFLPLFSGGAPLALRKDAQSLLLELPGYDG